MIAFHHLLQELSKVSCQDRVGIALAQVRPEIRGLHFLEDVQFAPPAHYPHQFRFHKQIQLARKGTPRSAGRLGHRLDQARLARAPVHDQAGVTQLGEPDDDPPGLVHPGFRCSVCHLKKWCAKARLIRVRALSTGCGSPSPYIGSN